MLGNWIPWAPFWVVHVQAKAVGSLPLLARLETLKPVLHVFGEPCASISLSVSVFASLGQGQNYHAQRGSAM